MEFYAKTPYIMLDGMEYPFSQQQVITAKFLFANAGRHVSYERLITHCQTSDRTVRDSIEKLRSFFADNGYVIRVNRRSSELGLFEVKK